MISTVADLENFIASKNLSWEQCKLPSREVFSKTFAMKIPLLYAELVDWEDSKDPLRLMVLPDEKELSIADYELADPIGDERFEKVRGLIHRYPDRCLLFFTTSCKVHCRFCFRRDIIGMPRPADIEGCLKYLREHEKISEVIFTGGDPAAFSAEFLEQILPRITEISHIKFVRFHTRALVMNPKMIGEKWLSKLSLLGSKKIIFALHINHVREISPKLKELILTLKSGDIEILAQTVLLKGVNDNAVVLAELFRGLGDIGIKPYYLHHPDFARGTKHFRISIERGREIFSGLRGKLSGHLIPEYVVDLPGGDGKYPVMWLKDLGGKTYEAVSFQEEKVLYTDPAEDF